MKTRRANTQMFALPHRPPAWVDLPGGRYRLEKVFKHDFFAATCLYELASARGADALRRVVVKFGRTQPFCGLPCLWLSELLRAHERDLYAAMAGVRGVPRWAGEFAPAGYAVEYIDARPLDHLDAPPAGLFDRLRTLFDTIHARGIGYADANKRSNILVTDAGEAYLIDYQISVRRRDDWPWPLRAILRSVVAYLQRSDLYHLYKHKRRLVPGELTSEEDALSRRRGWLHTLHRRLTDPWRALRRWFLRAQYRSGRLESPTATLEDHRQPEKETWRG